MQLCRQTRLSLGANYHLDCHGLPLREVPLRSVTSHKGNVQEHRRRRRQSCKLLPDITCEVKYVMLAIPGLWVIEYERVLGEVFGANVFEELA